MRFGLTHRGPDTLYASTVKRLLDGVAAAIGLVITAPFQALISVFVWRSMGRPVLFRQERPGWREKSFTIYKFRTMSDERDAGGQLKPDGERLTRFGNFLRHTSLDELPQLWNVLKGDMSLVGPRPFLVQYLPLYTPEQRRRHNVRPGITGWTAVNGRNNQTWEEKLASDVWYADNLSLALDLKILWRTVFVTAKREGVVMGSHATSEAFAGTQQSVDLLSED